MPMLALQACMCTVVVELSVCLTQDTPFKTDMFDDPLCCLVCKAVCDCRLGSVCCSATEGLMDLRKQPGAEGKNTILITAKKFVPWHSRQCMVLKRAKSCSFVDLRGNNALLIAVSNKYTSAAGRKSCVDDLKNK